MDDYQVKEKIMSKHSYVEIREAVEMDLYEELGRFATEEEIETRVEEFTFWLFNQKVPKEKPRYRDSSWALGQYED